MSKDSKNFIGYFISSEDKVATCEAIVRGDDELSQLYRLLGCDCIDIAYRRIGGKEFCIICDDEGLLKPNYPTLISKSCPDSDLIMGSVLIVSADNEDGEFESIERDDVFRIANSLAGVVRGTDDAGEGHENFVYYME